MDKTIVVKTDGGDVTVKKLAILDYADLLRALKNLPGELGSILTGEDKEKIQDAGFLFSVLPKLGADSLPELIEVIAIATDKDADFLGKLDLPDIVDIVVAALQVNDWKRVRDSVKKLTAPAQAPKN